METTNVDIDALAAHVSSSCPVTGEAIRLRVHPSEIETVDPASTVISFPRVDRMELGEDHVILALDDGLELARKKNAMQFGELG